LNFDWSIYIKHILLIYIANTHSFILDISIAPLQVHYYLEVLPTTPLIICQS